jgi:hypothetical protein
MSTTFSVIDPPVTSGGWTDLKTGLDASYEKNLFPLADIVARILVSW